MSFVTKIPWKPMAEIVFNILNCVCPECGGGWEDWDSTSSARGAAAWIGVRFGIRFKTAVASAKRFSAAALLRHLARQNTLGTSAADLENTRLTAQAELAVD
jgi:hypothetical protein